ncbi:MAG TPA: tripartite tricarboxylate transporter TctB family protein [candidate division Zixibacteria bacterium]|nr:tripartite tricarboxylate transporter TctB family protein [candidate division Zixibacteria bacterium]
MRTADLVTSALLILLSVVVMYDALRLGIGWGDEGPLSGFFPFWLAALLAAVSAALFLQALFRRATKPFVSRERFIPVLKVLGPLAAFIVVTDPPGPWSGLGLYVAGGLYLGFYMRWVGGHGWRAVVALSLTIPFITFLIFETWFLVPMPKGPVEAWFGY